MVVVIVVLLPLLRLGGPGRYRRRHGEASGAGEAAAVEAGGSHPSHEARAQTRPSSFPFTSWACSSGKTMRRGHPCRRQGSKGMSTNTPPCRPRPRTAARTATLSWSSSANPATATTATRSRSSSLLLLLPSSTHRRRRRRAAPLSPDSSVTSPGGSPCCWPLCWMPRLPWCV